MSRNLLQKLTGCFGSDFIINVLHPATRIIIPEKEEGVINQLRARHQEIAYIVATQTNELKDQNVKFERICSIIDCINAVNRRERYVILRLLQGLVYPNPEEGYNDPELAKTVMTRRKPQLDGIQAQAAVGKRGAELFAWASIYNKLGEFGSYKKCLGRIIWEADYFNPTAHYLYANVLNRLNSNPSEEEHAEVEYHFKEAYKFGLRSLKFFRAYIIFESKIGNFEKVAQLSEEALKIKPDSERLRNVYEKISCLYANLLLKLKQNSEYNRLIEICNSGLEVNPQNIKTRFTLANALESLGEEYYMDAVEHYKKITALKTVEEHPVAWDKCASILRKLGSAHHEEARNYLQSLIDKHNKKDVLAAKCRNSLAILLMEIGENEKAEELWKKAIDIFSDFSYSYIELGDFYYQKRQNIRNAIKYVLEGKQIAEKKSFQPALDKANELLDKMREQTGAESFLSIVTELQREERI